MKKIIMLVVLFLISCQLFSQSIGVVLSGGGAKGMYHIGILKALEENNIPIDYISGTSMGSIVAGLYASGYTIAEIEEIATSPDIEMWVSGKIDPKYNYFYNKQQERPVMVNFDFDINSLFRSKKHPKNAARAVTASAYYDENTSSKAISILVPSTQLDLGLMQYFSGPNAVAKNDFDSLYIPFRCVSIDAVSKTQYVWGHGELSQAIRASMAIPIVFSPVIIDTAIMFDGGVYNNFPWKETLKQWPVDFIIGGKCVAGKDAEITSTIGQAMALMTRPTDYNLPDSIGVMIARGVDVNVLDFSKTKQVIESGYRDAMAIMPIILSRIERRVNPEERDAKRLQFRSKIPALVFDRESLEKTMSKNYTADSLRADKKKEDEKRNVKSIFKKKIKRQSEFADLEELKHRYFRVMTEGTAKSGFPYAHYDDTVGAYDFDIKINRMPLLNIKAGLNISSTSINQGYLGLSYIRNKKISSFYSLDGYIGAFYSAGQITTRFNFYNRPRHVYLQNTFTYNHYNYSKANNQKYSYETGFALGQDRLNEFYISSLLGMPIGVRTKMEFRFSTGFDEFRVAKAWNELIYKINASIYFLSFNFKIGSSTLNDIMYPVSGFFQEFSVSANYSNNGVRYSSGETVAVPPAEKSNSYWASMRYSREQYFDLGKHFSLGYRTDAMFSTGMNTENVYINNYMAPRYAPTQLTKTLFIPEFQKNSYIALGIMPVVKIIPSLFFKAEVYGYWGNFYHFRDIKSNLTYIFAATAVYKLPFAPISLSYNRIGVGSVKKDYVLFNIGFMLFNPRGVVY